MSTQQCLERATMDADSTTMSSNVTTALANMKDETNSEDETPQRKNLSADASLIFNVLENAIRQLKVAAIIPALLRLNRESGIVDEELRRALQKHQLLVDRLDMQEGLKNEPEDAQDKESRERERAQLQKDAENSGRDLLRLFKARPNALHGLKEDQCMEAEGVESMLIKLLVNFQNMLPNADDPLAPEEQDLTSCVHEVELLASEKKRVASLMAKADAEMSELSQEIINLQLSSEEKDKLEIDVTDEKWYMPVMEASKAKQSKTQQEIDQLKTKIYNEINEYKQVERELREKNQKVEAETQHLIKNFDDEMMELQADIELNQKDCEKLEDELREMEKPFSILQQEYNQILERRRLAEETRREEMRDLELKTRAAILAQAWWRGYSIRKALKNKGKGKKAKKGKGKK